MEIPHHIKYKKSITISRWKKLGLILTENQTYEDIYEKVMNHSQCELCNVNLCDGVKSNSRTMDHCHQTGSFRKVLCRKCNNGYKRDLQRDNTSGIRCVHAFQNGWRYQPKKRKKGGYTKYSTNKSIVIWAKFIYEISSL